MSNAGIHSECSIKFVNLTSDTVISCSTPLLFHHLHVFSSALKTCSVELLLKVGTLLPEMAAHEKSLDYFIDLLRKDQVCAIFFYQIVPIGGRAAVSPFLVQVMHTCFALSS